MWTSLELNENLRIFSPPSTPLTPLVHKKSLILSLNHTVDCALHLYIPRTILANFLAFTVTRRCNPTTHKYHR